MRTRPHLSLYQYSSCPYCARVLGALDRLDLDVELRDVLENREHLRELVQATRRTTVPCLRIEHSDGRVEWLHESLDIIRYLEAGR